MSTDRDSMVGLKSPEVRIDDIAIGAAVEIKTRRRFDAANGPLDVIVTDSVLSVKSDWGRFKLGRAYTAAQDALYAFEPFEFRTSGSLLAITGNYASDPNVGGSAAYQFERAIHYESPAVSYLQAGLSLADRSSVVGSSTNRRQKLPYSMAVSYNMPELQAMLGVERGINGDQFHNVSASIPVGAVRWMLTVGRYAPVAGGSELSIAGGGVLQASASTTLRFGLGAVRSPAGISMRQLSAGCWVKLSKSVTFYMDASAFPLRTGEARLPVPIFDIGLRYVFATPVRSN